MTTDNITTSGTGDIGESAAQVVAALTREHREIDAGIEEFMAGLDQGEVRPEPLLTAMQALRRHIYLEEVFLFPPIRAAGMMMPIMVMLREHGQLWRAMDALTALVADLSADRADSAQAEQPLARCRELLAMLDQHNSKEEPIIYPRTESDLTAEATAELAEFLRSSDVPDGWVCQQAAA